MESGENRNALNSIAPPGNGDSANAEVGVEVKDGSLLAGIWLSAPISHFQYSKCITGFSILSGVTYRVFIGSMEEVFQSNATTDDAGSALAGGSSEIAGHNGVELDADYDYADVWGRRGPT